MFEPELGMQSCLTPILQNPLHLSQRSVSLAMVFYRSVPPCGQQPHTPAYPPLLPVRGLVLPPKASSIPHRTTTLHLLLTPSPQALITSPFNPACSLYFDPPLLFLCFNTFPAQLFFSLLVFPSPFPAWLSPPHRKPKRSP